MNIIKQYNLPYCTIQIRDDDIVVLEIQDGVDIDPERVMELMHLADENMAGPFAILSNKIHSYSLSFEAMSMLAHYDNLVALAIVVHSAKSRMLVETQNFFISALKKKPIKIFMDVDSADTWLQGTLQEMRVTS